MSVASTSSSSETQVQLLPPRPISMRRTAEQKAMLNAAKAAAEIAVDGGCILASSGAKLIADTQCVAIPVAVKHVVIDTVASAANQPVKELANKVIESNLCYGDENSCVSTTTKWAIEQINQAQSNAQLN